MTLPDATRFYIDGAWVAPRSARTADIVNPATGAPAGKVAMGDARDAEAAVAAARAAFPGWAATGVAERLALLRRIAAALERRNDDIADAITAEMGAPRGLSRRAQAPSGVQHFAEIVRVLESFAFERPLGTTLLRHEPVGVCALVTPWNWPMNQVATKVAPALAAGCTMVLKPSELAPLDAVILAEIVDAAGVPPGVFNLVHGDGPGIGAALAAHPEVDMVSFTGSTRAGVAIGEAAARTVKRVALELGGKSAAIVLDDADFATAIPDMVRGCMLNSGQSCNAPTRLLVPRERLEEAQAIAVRAAEALGVGMPETDPDLGPIANLAQYERVVAMIRRGMAEGCALLCGGPDRPEGLARGLFVRPTLFGDVQPHHSVAREEIFGPVLAIIAFRDEAEAVAIANDSPYGLSGYVWSGDPARAARVAARLRTGMVHLNGASLDTAAPFGGYKRSGNGREWGVHGLHEFLEVKSVYGGALNRAAA